MIAMRSIAAFFVGYLTLALIIVAGFAAGPVLLGVERILDDGTYLASTLWLALSSALGLIAAFMGGVICRRIARNTTVPLVLAVVVLLYGIAILVAGSTELPPPRPEGETGLDAMKKTMEYGYEPMVTKILNPIFGFVGVLAGAWWQGRRMATKASAG